MQLLKPLLIKAVYLFGWLKPQDKYELWLTDSKQDKVVVANDSKNASLQRMGTNAFKRIKLQRGDYISLKQDTTKDLICYWAARDSCLNGSLILSFLESMIPFPFLK